MGAIETFVNHRKDLLDELSEFVTYYDGDQVELIQALADKIEHMCIYIGSPVSVIPMLKSIVKGKLKTWGQLDFEVPQKLKGRIHQSELERRYEKVVKGHFRWNFGKGYIANYHTRNYIESFFLTKNFEKKAPKLRVKVKRYRVCKYEGVTVIHVTTPKNNEYNYFHYDDGTFSCNMDDGKLTESELKWMKNVLSLK